MALTTYEATMRIAKVAAEARTLFSDCEKAARAESLEKGKRAGLAGRMLRESTEALGNAWCWENARNLMTSVHIDCHKVWLWSDAPKD